MLKLKWTNKNHIYRKCGNSSDKWTNKCNNSTSFPGTFFSWFILFINKHCWYQWHWTVSASWQHQLQHTLLMPCARTTIHALSACHYSFNMASTCFFINLKCPSGRNMYIKILNRFDSNFVLCIARIFNYMRCLNIKFSFEIPQMRKFHKKTFNFKYQFSNGDFSIETLIGIKVNFICFYGWKRSLYYKSLGHRKNNQKVINAQ